MERAILAGLNSDCLTPEENSSEESLDELEALLETAGGVCAAKVMQNRETPDPRTFIGEGKAREIKELAASLEATMLIMDNELNASRIRALEEDTGLHVLDRSALILDIFAQRAQTREGRLQVELAQYKYILPRLSGMGSSMSRLGGGIGTRGPGETQLETDRRHIRSRITRLEAELKDVRKVRGVQRERRLKSEVPVIAIVGYTNAGKSTLLNRLTDAGIPANNRLFDTLDTTTRRLQISDTCSALISDTVGFISKLPHHLVEAFKATLEELSYADLLLHVIDGSREDWQAQAAVVESLISELGAEKTPRIDVFNKMDMVTGEIIPRGENIISVSAKTGQGMDELMEKIAARLDLGKRAIRLLLPYDRGGLLDSLYKEAKVGNVEYAESGISVDAVCSEKFMGKYKDFIVTK